MESHLPYGRVQHVDANHFGGGIKTGGSVLGAIMNKWISFHVVRFKVAA